MTLLATARLRLEPITDAHFDGLHAMNVDPEVMRHVGGALKSPDETRAIIERTKTRWAEVGYSWWAFVARDTGDVVGAGCLQNLRREMQPLPDPDCPLEIGWRLRREHWGRGYASEAAIAIADHAFDALRPAELLAVCEPANTASAGVMARIGMQPAGLQRWYGKEMTTYRLSAAEWATARASR